jgi:hypothetical protein
VLVLYVVHKLRKVSLYGGHGDLEDFPAIPASLEVRSEEGSRAEECHGFRQLVAVDEGALCAQSALDRRDCSGAGVGVLGRGDAACLPGREGGSHDAK